MPVVSGLEALKMYRFTATKPIPILMLSANVTTEAIEQCHAAGAAEFVQKPVRASLLLDAIDRNLSDRAAEFVTMPKSLQDGRASLVTLDSPPLDGNVIADLARLSKDPTFEVRLLRGVRSDCSQLVEQIIAALAQNNYQDVSNAAHALKGAAGNVGAGLWVQFAERLEKASHETLRQKARALAQELSNITKRTVAALDSHIEGRRDQRRSSTHQM
jgi:two-component system, sensor histidine kinase RpfC